ncbi:hypothetical protein Gohar_027539 [Gossypium harknessii]|uniref:Uncharacterized protein n=1 Tax=Gossypium harknessii TaxID=34285 RepID=A0A7J9HV39_9ROSI|nr:hypothetical protein [Gossypium harknessii]
MDSRLSPIENTTVNEDTTRNDTNKNIHDCSDSSSYYSKVDHLVDVKNIQNFLQPLNQVLNIVHNDLEGLDRPV